MEENEYIIKDGTLYHAGVKGMSWGKHLPGTDWWKDLPSKSVPSYAGVSRPPSGTGRHKVSKVNKANSAQTNSFENKIEGHKKVTDNKLSKVGYTFRDFSPDHSKLIYKKNRKPNATGDRNTFKYKAEHVITKVSNKITDAANIGKNKAGELLKSGKSGLSKLWGNSKKYSSEQISKLKDQAKKAFAKTRPLVQSYFEKSSEKYSKGVVNPPKGSDSINHLAEYIDKEMEDAIRAYGDMQKSGSAGSMLNSFIQTSQMNIVNGCARFLDSIGMDDEVASFLSKLKIKK